jgi:hypothetical protein
MCNKLCIFTTIDMSHLQVSAQCSQLRPFAGVSLKISSPAVKIGKGSLAYKHLSLNFIVKNVSHRYKKKKKLSQQNPHSL